jgi:hypothetical protein
MMAKQRTGPPFTPEVNLFALPGKSEVTIEVTEKKPAAKSREFIDESLSYFITAADAGMFPAAGNTPAQSEMAIVSKEDSKETVKRHCQIRGVDPASYKILLGVLSQIHHKLAPLVKVRLVSSPSSGDRLSLETLLSSPFPARAKPIPFDLRLDEQLAENNEPVLRLEFQEELGDKGFETLKQRVAAWGNLVMLGGYRDSFSKMEHFPLVPGEFYLAGPRLAEHEISGFDGPVTVFDSLINMAIKFHGTVCPVKSLEIE